MLEIDVQKKLGDLELNMKVSLASQGITAIFGLSGAGKTSLINLISGLIQPDSGKIILNQRSLFDSQNNINVPTEKRKIGYVFQDARLFPHYTVAGNLRYGMSKSMQHEFEAIVQLLGISHLLKRYPTTLSGGEKQRVAIGRALLTAPELLLMDEPLASLDIPRKQELLPYLEQLSHQIKIPILYVSHSIDEILRLADNIAIIEKGQLVAHGKLDQIWSEQALQPWITQQDYTNVIILPFSHYHATYEMSALKIDQQLIWINGRLPHNHTPHHVRIKASDISLSLVKNEQSSIRNLLLATINEYQTDKQRVMVNVSIGEHQIWLQITRWAFDDLKLNLGQKVYIQIKSVSVA